MARIASEHLDSAARGVAAEECALRSVQYLHAIDVAEGEVGGGQPGVIDVVNVHCDAGLVADVPSGVVSDAAQEGQVDAGGVVHAQRRVDLGEVFHRGDPAGLQRRAVEGAHRNRSVLQVLLSALRRDDDFLELIDTTAGRDRLLSAGGARLLCGGRARLLGPRGRRRQRASYQERVGQSPPRGGMPAPRRRLPCDHVSPRSRVCWTDCCFVIC